MFFLHNTNPSVKHCNKALAFAMHCHEKRCREMKFIRRVKSYTKLDKIHMYPLSLLLKRLERLSLPSVISQ